MVLHVCCGTQQDGAADVDFLHSARERAAWTRDGRREWVEVTDDDRDRRDGVRHEVLLVAGNVASEFLRGQALITAEGLLLS